MELRIIKIFALKVFNEKRFHKLRNLVNTALPIFIAILVVSIGTKSSVDKNKQNAVIFDSFAEDELLNYYPSRPENKLFFTPNNTITYNLIEKVRYKLHIVSDRVQSLRNEQELEQELLRSKDYFAIIFTSKNNYSDMSYTIRTDNNNFRTTDVYSRNLYQSFLKDKNEYFDSGFLALQTAINKEYIRLLTNLESLMHLEFEHVPKPADNPSMPTNIEYFGSFVGIFFAVPYIFLVLLTIVEEKSIGFKEHLKIATKFSYYNEVAIATINFCHFFLVFAICLFISDHKGMWDGLNFMLVFLLVFLFLASFMSYTFFMSTFFDTVLIANICGPLFYYIPYIIEILWNNVEIFTVISFPLNTYMRGIKILSSYKSSGHEFSWGDLFHSDYPGDVQFSMFSIYISMIGQTFVYLLLYFYVSNVRPGQFGTPKSWFFFIDRNHKIDCCMAENSTLSRHKVSENCKHLKSVVNVKGLRKVFKFENQTKEAVKNVDLDIYKNQITALLGHNGAGKTTTMNIIAGITPKTTGTVCVDGEENVDVYRSKLGFCPQHNVFLRYLTCHQHLKLFGTLRCLNSEEVNRKATEILENVGLIDKKNEYGDKLSGGMKRRLCLANAIIGETKVLILDEPTSGLDPESRREIWDILLKLKKNHTILITTHFMEEADVLGDKIAIMEHGEIIAFGTSIFLKNHYGSGYILKLLKSIDFKQKEVVETLERHIKGYQKRESVEPVYCVALPYSAIDKYSELLKELEDNVEEFGIESISITNTNLEEVFLKSSIEDRAIQIDGDEIDSVVINAETKSLEKIKIDQKNLKMQQFWAILYKKFIFTKRNWILTASLAAIPLFLTLICFLLTSHGKTANYHAVELHHSNVEDSICFISIHNYSGAEELIESLKEKYGHKVDIKLVKDKNIHDHLIEESEDDMIRYNDRIVSVLDVSPSDDILKVMYSNNILHSIGISLNIATDLMLNYYGYGNSSIMVTNKPSTRQALIDLHTPLFLTEAIPYGFMVFMLLFLQLPFIEFSTEFKSLQSIQSWFYWLVTFIYDFAMHFFVCLFCYGLCLALDRDGVLSAGEMFHIFLICLVYGCAQLLLIYIVSQSFNNLNSCITFLSYTMIFSIIGSAMLLNSAENITKNSFLIVILHMMPDFAFRSALKTMYENQKTVKMEQVRFPEMTIDEIEEKISRKMLGYSDFYIMMTFVIICFASFLLFVIEKMYRREKGQMLLKKIKHFYKIGMKTISHCRKPIEKDSDTPDHGSDLKRQYEADVEIEKDLVKSLIDDEEKKKEYSLIVHNLQKQYDELTAVDGINIAVKKGECFGLLGMNGAGKTTTFKMMTKCDTITSGDVHIHDSQCTVDDDMYKFKFGYCPQTDALMGFMTSYEILKYLGKIKGIPCANIDEEVNKWLNRVDITNYKFTEVKFYSGGTKRKLNTALAMIGDPPVVFLDEPTTGVDPKSRRFVWKCIKDFQQNEQTIILTSHSMDECEELCNRLAIMAKGQLKCIGGIQKLKQKFGSGFSLLIKLKPEILEAPEELKNNILDHFKCSLKDEHYGNLHYFVRGLKNSSKIVWSEIFAKLMELKTENEEIIDSFSVNETTLEEIFLCFRPPTAASTNDKCNEESVKIVLTEPKMSIVSSTPDNEYDKEKAVISPVLTTGIIFRHQKSESSGSTDSGITDMSRFSSSSEDSGSQDKTFSLSRERVPYMDSNIIEAPKMRHHYKENIRNSIPYNAHQSMNKLPVSSLLPIISN